MSIVLKAAKSIFFYRKINSFRRYINDSHEITAFLYLIYASDP